MPQAIPSYISKITTLADSTVRLIVDTQETTPENMQQIFALKGKLGWCIFQEQLKQEEWNDIELPDITLEQGEKPPSVRLRNVLFKVHEKRGGKPDTFDAFYRQQVERFIERCKEELN